MNIIDSSAWLEVLVDGPNRPTFVKVIEEGELVVPAITILKSASACVPRSLPPMPHEWSRTCAASP